MTESSSPHDAQQPFDQQFLQFILFLCIKRQQSSQTFDRLRRVRPRNACVIHAQQIVGALRLSCDVVEIILLFQTPQRNVACLIARPRQKVKGVVGIRVCSGADAALVGDDTPSTGRRRLDHERSGSDREVVRSRGQTVRCRCRGVKSVRQQSLQTGVIVLRRAGLASPDVDAEGVPNGVHVTR